MKRGSKHRDHENTKISQKNVYSTRDHVHFLGRCTLCLTVSLERHHRLTSQEYEDGAGQFNDF